MNDLLKNVFNNNSNTDINKTILRSDAPDLLKSSYQSQYDAKQNMEKKGYTMDPLSTVESKVFVKDGKATIVHRGSKRLTDWAQDGLIALGLGKYTDRQKKANEITKKVQAKYGDANSVGHSLGGYLAENSGAKGNIITYNKAASSQDIFKRQNKNQNDIRTQGDLVSILGHNSNTEVIKNKNKNKNFISAHDLNNLNFR